MEVRASKDPLFVLKISGKILERKELLSPFAKVVKGLRDANNRVIVVHGGGVQLSELARKMGVSSPVIQGRRVTDGATLELAQMVFLGLGQPAVVTALAKEGLGCVGLSGIDDGTILAHKRPPLDMGADGLVDYGFVGEIVEVRTRLILQLLSTGHVPVISPLGVDGSGQVYNINADTIACAVATAVGATKLVLISDTPGLLRDGHKPDSLIEIIEAAELRMQIDSGEIVASAGMLPKLSAIFKALDRHVPMVQLLNGQTPELLLRSMLEPGSFGTTISSNPLGDMVQENPL